jgi:hypothetical protein
MGKKFKRYEYGSETSIGPVLAKEMKIKENSKIVQEQYIQNLDSHLVNEKGAYF